MKQAFQKISHFLKKYSSLYDREFLKKYPEPYADYLQSWLAELDSWNFEQLAQLESHPHEDLVQNTEFKSFLKNVRELTNIDKKELKGKALDDGLARKLNPKKRHEISLLKSLVDEKKCETIIDIGGGVGHLSCALVQGQNKRSICVDRDSNLQEIGKLKVQKWLPEKSESIIFETLQFDETSQIKNSFVPKQSLVVGLHGCGKLSTSTVRFTVANKISQMISFGCCYHKLDGQYNISQWSKKEGLVFSTNALHLASRCGSIITSQDLEKRLRFKRYRYTLHYFLNDKFNIPFSGLGNASKADYSGDFASYAKKYYTGNELEKISDNELNEFFEKPETREKVITHFKADLIRLLLGRVIEVYLLLDRCLYLVEKGYTAKMLQVFDRKISPRNIMIEV